ncbi:MutS-related protein [Paenibacillus eucommiae]|uniref:DNA mismatch repair proteins mutS family domain-containing protein n=1 Tax=Paenibacillus eucommiae TaxID=1355755 RepID=A0ABS4INK4_9BACL|nr:hypothetical protein [Paenibacillus eucommiae]MBP1989151.1 hypothetical protein [Paenibacillus eucommiae]
MKPALLYDHQDPYYLPLVYDQELIQDLQLPPLLERMARQDTYMYNSSKQVIMHSEMSVDTLKYRQQILKDGMNHPALIKSIYAAAADIAEQADAYRSQMKPNYSRNIPVREKLKTAVSLLEVILINLKKLRDLGLLHKAHYRSGGLAAFFNRLDLRYPDSFLSGANQHLRLLQQAIRGTRLVIGARIGEGLKGIRYTLREVYAEQSFLSAKKIGKASTLVHFEHNFSEIEETVQNHILKILKRFIDETLSFADLLRFESSFYVGCLHLHEELVNLGCEISFPLPLGPGSRSLTFRGLYEPVLAMISRQQPVTNGLRAEDKTVFIVTGANQGGKTTFLRSIGLAQLMMQCGMFVPAAFYESNLCDRIFSHFTREEDRTLNSGKLDEELSRLNAFIDHLTPGSLLLMNEPFASTTEKEGSLIAKDLLSVCHELKLKVFIVTHFYELAEWAYTGGLEQAVFLAPERNDRGTRSFKLSAGVPQPTSYGEDLYRAIIEHTGH